MNRGEERLRRHLVVAADVGNAAAAESLARRLSGRVAMVKVGLQLFVGDGAAVVPKLTAQHIPFLLDLKLHDIPNTVGAAAEASFRLGARAITVHALGGGEMIAAAAAAADKVAQQQGRPCQVLAVTILTSHDDASLARLGLGGSCSEAVLRLGALALQAGADGLVASPQEVAALRREFGPAPHLLVPGIRPAGSASHDQKRIATPAAALRDGATWLVVGRPITQAPDPVAALDAIAAELAQVER